MLFDRRLVAGLAGLVAATGVNAACSSKLVIDDFTTWLDGVNNLDSQNGDDGTMTAIAAAPGHVDFIPKDDGSYYYESFECIQAITEGYNAIEFTVQGPAGGSFAFELQTTASCSTSQEGSYNSSWNIVTDLTGQRQTVTLPLEGWEDSPNYDGIVGLVWSTFSQTDVVWSVGNVTLLCGGGGSGESTAPGSSKHRRLVRGGNFNGRANEARAAAPPTRTSSLPTTSRATTLPPTVTSKPGTCSNLLIDDWESQSRLTFLGYNAMLQTSSDDATMSSVVVSDNRVMLTPVDDDSYFYSQFGCLDTKGQYGGISFPIRAAKGTSFSVTVTYATTCGSGRDKEVTLTTSQLKWTFDGTEKLYSFPFSAFTGVDTSKLTMVYFAEFSGAVVFGPMSFYCGTTASEYTIPAGPATSPPITRSTTSAPAPAKTLLIDDFANSETNALGRVARRRRRRPDDYLWKQVQPGHQAVPRNLDSLEAARYSTASDIYMPINHFNVNLTRIIGFALKGFYSTQDTKITKMEIVDSLPTGWKVPTKLASGNLVFSCTRPNSFAVAIDDGDPQFAARVMDIIKQADIPVTFFTVGLALLDTTNGLADIYKGMAAQGHQIALHSYTHPKMEGLPSEADIDWEYNNDIGAVRQVFGSDSGPGHSNYFRPPFGTEGARMRQRLAATLDDPSPYIVQWSIDIEDWIWAESDTPEKQLDAFKRDVEAGGNLMVMHYLYNSTVELLPEFIRIAKGTGKTLMRVDQCLEDPNAPPL
ncbi:hypothetical protein CHGG_03804 [Chaetomium globosum CBS 148.51]|uniref:NodB homology domain-containing protein n=1 Tax=Chaetomium globosum (strain ATCC 6205 / CBS 148.51 / DSM 1962 / NBRC 6347 / NRRL 1970) TaxID=306901 RepID=Q2H342_CHAGB|nr:uncharacterized protein CHGG_03804 [Chaetomium globosum CBS 148.51]EAQ87185.1 hypothetical protein CHGG_03804 [Chaetomium globosum CBS 148.51]